MSYPDHGSAPVKAHAFAPRHGEFTRLTLSLKYGVWRDDPMIAASFSGSPPGWANVQSVKSSGMKLWTG